MADEEILAKLKVEAAQDATTARLEALALLNPIEYDRAREKAAEELCIRVGTLDSEVAIRRPAENAAFDDSQGQGIFLADPEPWPHAVNGVELLDELCNYFLVYLTLPAGGAEALTLWTVFSHAHDVFQVSPILGITSPERGCGKTTLEAMLSAIVPRPLSIASITSAALFRAVEKFRPTVIADEAEGFLPENEELRCIFNSGWLRPQAQVVRTIGDDHEPRLFSTWAPKVLALIGYLPSSLSDRAVEIRMSRQTADEERNKLKLRMDRLGELEHLRRKSWRWTRDNLEKLRASDPQVPAGLANRLADNWRPLLSVADVVGGKWPVRARDIAINLSSRKSEESIGALLLSDLRELFTGKEQLSSQEIVDSLIAMEDRPWPEFSDHGRKPITKRALARLLSRFGVTPKNIRDDVKVLKGYTLEDLKDSFSRFASAEKSATTLHSTLTQAMSTVCEKSQNAT